MTLSASQKSLALWVLDHLVWFILLAVLLVFSLAIPGYGQWDIYKNVFYHATFVGILAIGLAIALISGEIDLSSESVLALSVVSTAFLTGLGTGASGLAMNGLLTLLIVLGVGVLAGLLNGMLVAIGKINSFIITLAGLLAYRALGLMLTEGRGISGLPEEVIWVARAYVGPIPVMVVVFISTYVAFHLFLTRTQFGRYIYLVGDSRVASRNAGIRIERVVIGVFIISGVLAAFGGWLLAARTNGASPAIATGILFEAFAAVVIGGVSLQGGRGSIPGIFAGAVLLSSISTAITLIGMPPTAINLVRAILIAVAVLLDALVLRIRPRLITD